MAAFSISHALRETAATDERTVTIPNPAKVRTTAAAIRRGWSPRERQRRAEIARSMILCQFASDLFDTTSRSCPALRPRSRS
jgi:hypothetical protein